MLSDINEPGPGFEYFLDTSCQDWDAVQYHEAWKESNLGLDKAIVTRSFNKQMQKIKEQGTEEEKKNAIRLENQFRISKSHSVATHGTTSSHGYGLRLRYYSYPWNYVFAWLWTTSPLLATATHGTTSSHGYGLQQIESVSLIFVNKINYRTDVTDILYLAKVFTGINNLNAKPITKRNRDEKNSDDKIKNIKKPYLMKSNQNDNLILKSADSKINQKLPSEYNGLIYTPHMYVDIEPEYYDARKRTKIIYSWEDAIDKIDFRNISNKDRIFESYNLSNEFRSINKDNEDTFVHSILHNLINEIFHDPMLELVWANSESFVSKSQCLNNKENAPVKGNKSDFKILTNTKDEVLFGEVKPRDSTSVLVKKDLVKLAEFQAGTLDELTKKYGNRIGMISFGIWICGEHIRIYDMDLNYDGIYRMILVADVCVPIEREKIVGFLPVLEAFYNVKHRISELLTVIASNTPPSSPSRSSYGRMPTC
ncbi:6938_t:CDS:10 [Cetraspora pellucida]|uniref:6938_t:CDS:1 n=1 Tax=Cetraspora pellucida TaxID=1433469 RepID=A0A9N9N6S1_9GLOM|nr:6938_t:CDS:10 [Cetraspora pellucida]